MQRRRPRATVPEGQPESAQLEATPGSWLGQALSQALAEEASAQTLASWPPPSPGRLRGPSASPTRGPVAPSRGLGGTPPREPLQEATFAPSHNRRPPAEAKR